MRAEEWARGLAETIRNEGVADDQLADTVGDLRAAERVLADVRRMLMSELTGPVVGERAEVTESRSAKRSYNTSGLLSAFGGFDALPRLVSQDVVRVSWQWSNLRRVAAAEDVTLSVASHEIEDGDTEALIGEVWESKYEVKPK